MKMNSMVKFCAIIVILPFTINVHAQNISDTNSVQQIIHEEIAAWNKGDAEAYSKHFAEDGTFTNILGLFYTGQKEFLVRHEQIFKGVFSGTELKQTIVSLKFASPDLAVVETLTSVSGFSQNGPPKGTYLDEKGRLNTRLLQVMVRNDNDWKILSYHNVDIKPGVTVPELQIH